MGVPCRWHIARIGVPQFRSAAVAIALVIVGSMLPLEGVVARTPIESSDAPAPIAAVTGSGDALVAMVLPGPAASVAPATDDAAIARTADAWSFGAPTPDALRPFGIVSTAPASTSLAVTPLRALDPELRADLLLAAFSIAGTGPLDAAPAGVAVQGQASVGTRTTSAAAKTATSGAARKATTSSKKAKSSTSRRMFKRHWKRPVGPWRVSQKVTWYGPGFYGNGTACGQKYTRTIIGVAHRTLPCGTLVQFKWGGITAVAPVIDRGPYGHAGLLFDWSAWFACRTFKPAGVKHGCYTRSDVKYRIVGKVNLKKWFKAREAEKRKRQG